MPATLKAEQTKKPTQKADADHLYQLQKEAAAIMQQYRTGTINAEEVTLRLGALRRRGRHFFNIVLDM